MTTLRRKSENSLKVAVLGLGLAGACTALVAAAPAPLLVGAVRDQNGAPVAAATVEALDQSGRADGSAQTDGTGTFAVSIARPASAVVVSCRFCAPRRLPVTVDAAGEAQPLAVIVTRYTALSERGLSQRDYAELPYRRPSDATGLVPYLVPVPPKRSYGASVTDRGLDLGYALVLDQGASSYDLSGQSNAFSTAPDRSVQRVDFSPANFAYRYGNDAGGGTFVLDERGDRPGAAAFDSGVDGTLAGYAWLGAFAPQLAESRDWTDGLVRRRGGLDYQSDFAGGVLRVGAAAASVSPIDGTTEAAVNDDLVHAEYATASRRYRTFASAAASETNVINSPTYGSAVSRSSAVVGSFRLEHPSAITTAFGLAGQTYSGSYAVPSYGSVDARLGGDLAYLEASGVTGPLHFDGGLAFSQLGIAVEAYGRGKTTTLSTLQPSVNARYDLGGGFGLRGTVSNAVRAATLPELFVTEPLQGNPFERSALTDGGLEWSDSARIRVDALVFSEHLTGFVDRDVTGVGASVAWQVSPLISLRAWTLNNSGDQTSEPLLYVPVSPLAFSRGVVWANYDNHGGLRFDAIFHRDVWGGPAQSDVDGDVVVPLTRSLAATAGSSSVNGTRTFYAGLRLR